MEAIENGTSLLTLSYRRYYSNKVSKDNIQINSQRLIAMLKGNLDIKNNPRIEFIKTKFSTGINQIEIIVTKFKLSKDMYILFSPVEALLISVEDNNIVHLGDISGLTPLRKTETRKTEFIGNILRCLELFCNQKDLTEKDKENVVEYMKVVKTVFNARINI